MCACPRVQATLSSCGAKNEAGLTDKRVKADGRLGRIWQQQFTSQELQAARHTNADRLRQQAQDRRKVSGNVHTELRRCQQQPWRSHWSAPWVHVKRMAMKNRKAQCIIFGDAVISNCCFGASRWHKCIPMNTLL